MRGNTASATGRTRHLLGRIFPLGLCALLASSCSVASAHAQSWQCRAPEGSFANHDIAVPETATQFTGEMVIKKANGLSRWRPTAKVAFTELPAAASGCRCNGVVATWYPQTPDSFLVSLLADGKEIPLGLVPYDKPVTYQLTFNPDGELKLEVGTGVAKGRSSTPRRNNLHLSCSTADVDFHVRVAGSPPRSSERCPFAAKEQWSREDVKRLCKAGG